MDLTMCEASGIKASAADIGAALVIQLMQSILSPLSEDERESGKLTPGNHPNAEVYGQVSISQHS